MQTAQPGSRSASGSLRDPDPDQPGPSSTNPTPADLSTFLQPSFDAATYVASLLNQVDPTYASTSNGISSSASPTAPSAAAKHPPLLTPPPTSPTTARNASISLSPISPTAPSSEKHSQAQEDLDLSLAISRLNLAIEELDRSIESEVTANAPELLKRTGRLGAMQKGVGETRSGVESLSEEVERLRGKVREPFRRVVELQRELKVVEGAGELVGRTRGVVALARRLEVQMEVLFQRKEKALDGEGDGNAEDAVVGQVHGRDLSRAALLVAELTALLDAEKTSTTTPSLLDLKLIQNIVPTVDSARKTIIDYMEDMIVRGLRDLSPLMLSSSLQTAFNLRMLPTLVQDLLNDLTEVVKERTAAAFDLESVSRQLNLPLPSLESLAPSYSTYRGVRRTNTAAGEDDLLRHQQKFSDAIWTRLESLIVTEMGAVCSKVYLLEKVLKLKNDGETGVNFLAAALEVLGDKPSKMFWLTLAQSLQQQVESACGRSAWLTQLLSSGSRQGGDGYPRLVRMVQEFFAKISVYADVQYGTANQSAETVILMKSLRALEKGYVEKSTSKIAEVLTQVGGSRVVAGEEEADAVVRSIANVLDTTRFDPVLSRAVVVRCVDLVDRFVTRLDAVATKDHGAWALIGERATQGQTWNAGLVRFAYTLSQGLANVAGDQDGIVQTSATTTALAPTKSSSISYAATQLNILAQSIATSTRTSLLQPLMDHVHTAISTSVSKMHVQLASASKAERGVSIDSTTGASPYASSICNVVLFLHERLLPLYPVELRTAVAHRVAALTVRTFCLHASIFAFPEQGGDAVRLRLATDMTELEFALSQLVGDQRTARSGDEWLMEEKGQHAFVETGGDAWMKSLKSFRRLLFFTLDDVEREMAGIELPSLLIVLHLLSSEKGALDKVTQRAMAETGEAKAKDEKAAFVEWVLRHSQQNVLERVAGIALEEVDDERSRRVVSDLMAR
ncbi:Conserved oligomeric Golgi complex subunit 5 [Pseudozyma hubeiensis]|nr:Conserved oligomeric Golgi complex subunit 5 [Pseudozyma hubeiensis]